MSNEGEGPSLLSETLTGISTILIGIAGYIGLTSVNSARKIVELNAKVESMKETLLTYRTDDLMHRVDIIRRLERLERVTKGRKDYEP